MKFYGFFKILCEPYWVQYQVLTGRCWCLEGGASYSDWILDGFTRKYRPMIIRYIFSPSVQALKSDQGLWFQESLCHSHSRELLTTGFKNSADPVPNQNRIGLLPSPVLSHESTFCIFWLDSGWTQSWLGRIGRVNDRIGLTRPIPPLRTESTPSHKQSQPSRS